MLVLYGKSYIYRQAPDFTPVSPTVSQPTGDAITIHYHERVPYYVTGPNGVYGLCATPARLAFENAGIPYRWQKTPAKRQIGVLKENKEKECILGWFKNSDRETFAKFSLPIYQDKPLIAIARSDNSAIESGQNLKNTLSNPSLVLLKKDGYSYGRFVDEMIARFKPKHMATTSELMGMLQMVHSGRADYFFIAEGGADGLIASSDLPNSDFQYIRFSDMPEGNKRYILFSKKVEDRIIEKINSALLYAVQGSAGTPKMQAGVSE
nr:hypothetical protein [uncultured bacterium]